LQYAAPVVAEREGYVVKQQLAGEFVGSTMRSWDFGPSERPDPMGILEQAGIDPAYAVDLRQSTSSFSRWNTLLLTNPQNTARDLLLEFRYPSLTDVEFFSFRNGKLQDSYRAGIRIPYRSRPIDRRFPVFPVRIAAGDSVFLLIMYNRDGALLSGQLRDNAYLWNRSEYFSSTYDSDILYWVFFGALFSMMAYHAAAAFANREPIYVFYTGFCASYLFMQFSAAGFAFALLWPKLPVLNTYMPLTTLAIMATMLIYFAISFLTQQDEYRRVRRAVRTITALCFLVALPAFYLADTKSYLVSSFAMFTVVVTVVAFLTGALLLALREWFRGNRRGRQFTFAWALFLVAQSTGVLNWLDVISTGVNQAYVSMTGALVSLSLIGGFLADRSNQFRMKDQLTKGLMQVNERLNNEIQERRAAEERAQHLANHDALTGLPTLRLARERLQQSVAIARRSRDKTAVLFIDLDGFKAVNDSLGHEAGDQLLKQVATRMTACMRDSDTVARIGGDEFLVIQTNIGDSSAIVPVAEKLLRAVSESCDINGTVVKVSASIGIAICPDHGTTIEALLKGADAAMYAIKRTGKNSYGFVEGTAPETVQTPS